VALSCSLGSSGAMGAVGAPLPEGWSRRDKFDGSRRRAFAARARGLPPGGIRLRRFQSARFIGQSDVFAGYGIDQLVLETGPAVHLSKRQPFSGRGRGIKGNGA
jgi:hypothetical protein